MKSKNYVTAAWFAAMLFIGTNLCYAQELYNTLYQYDDISEFLDDGLRRVSSKGKYGFIDIEGIEVIPLKYEDAFNFRNGLAPVMLNGKWGYIDVTGKEITLMKYDVAFNFQEKVGVAAVILNGRCAYIDKTGKEITPFKYTPPMRYYVCEIQAFPKGIQLEPEEKYSVEYINSQYPKRFRDERTGKGTHPRYVEMGRSDDTGWRDFYEGLATVSIPCPDSALTRKEQYDLQNKIRWRKTWEGPTRCGFIDTTGKEVIPLVYVKIGGFGECTKRQHCWVSTAKKIVQYGDSHEYEQSMFLDIMGNEYPIGKIGASWTWEKYDKETDKILKAVNKAMRELEKTSEKKPSKLGTGKS